MCPENAIALRQITVKLSVMPVYLSFLICALSGGGCHVSVPVEDPFAGISACQMQGMILAPQWLDQHPGWIIQRIRRTRPLHDV